MSGRGQEGATCDGRFGAPPFGPERPDRAGCNPWRVLALMEAVSSRRARSRTDAQSTAGEIVIDHLDHRTRTV